VYYFIYESDGITYLYQFIGTNGTYGDGETPITESDLKFITSSAVEPSVGGDLQTTLESGNTTTLSAVFQNDGKNTIVEGGEIRINNPTTETDIYLKEDRVDFANGVGSTSLTFEEPTEEGVLIFPNKNGTLATLDDVATPTLQEVTDEGFFTTNPLTSSQYVGALTANSEETPIYNGSALLPFEDVGALLVVKSTETTVDEFYLYPSIADDKWRYIKNGDFEYTVASETYVNAIIINSATTAINNRKYTAIATLTVTDPTPVEGQGYIVFVRNGTTTIDGVGYTSGNLIYRFYQGGAWSSTVFVSQNQISQILRFLDNESTFEFTQTSDFKINSVVEQSGTEAIIKLSDGTTDYVLGDTVDAFDYLIISVDVAGTIELIGEKL
jgi:hypothetical protein